MADAKARSLDPFVSWLFGEDSDQAALWLANKELNEKVKFLSADLVELMRSVDKMQVQIKVLEGGPVEVAEVDDVLTDDVPIDDYALLRLILEHFATGADHWLAGPPKSDGEPTFPGHDYEKVIIHLRRITEAGWLQLDAMRFSITPLGREKLIGLRLVEAGPREEASETTKPQVCYFLNAGEGASWFDWNTVKIIAADEDARDCVFVTRNGTWGHRYEVVDSGDSYLKQTEDSAYQLIRLADWECRDAGYANWLIRGTEL